MQEFANLTAVGLVIIVSVVLLLILLRLHSSSPENPTILFGAQLISLWIIGWGIWGVLWGIEAFVPYRAVTEENTTQSSLLSDLLATNNAFSPVLWKKLSPNSMAQTSLVNVLDSKVRSDSLFDPSFLKLTNVSSGTLDLLAQIPKGTSLIKFNQQLLHDFYGQHFIVIIKPNWQWLVRLCLSSANTVTLLLVLIVIKKKEREQSSILVIYGFGIGVIIAAYYGIMYGLTRLGSPEGAFERLLLWWSVAESIIAPLLLSWSIKELTDKWPPLIFGVLYAFAQPIVYDVELAKSGISDNDRDRILVSLAVLKVLFAASILYSIGRHINKAYPFQTIRVPFLGRERKITRWDTAVGLLVIVGMFATAGTLPGSTSKLVGGVATLGAITGIMRAIFSAGPAPVDGGPEPPPTHGGPAPV